MNAADTLPKLAAAAKVLLKEVGTTNRTLAADYEAAFSPRVAAILKLSPDTYRVVGETAAAELDELVALSRDRELLLIDALGTAPIVDPPPSISWPQRSVRASLASWRRFGDRARRRIDRRPYVRPAHRRPRCGSSRHAASPVRHMASRCAALRGAVRGARVLRRCRAGRGSIASLATAYDANRESPQPRGANRAATRPGDRHRFGYSDRNSQLDLRRARLRQQLVVVWRGPGRRRWRHPRLQTSASNRCRCQFTAASKAIDSCSTCAPSSRDKTPRW